MPQPWALVGRKRLGIDRNAIAMILVMHVHADPFGGVPVFSLDAPFFARRTRPLVIAGPAGLRDCCPRVMETAFPGATSVRQTVEIALADLRPADAWKNGGLSAPPTLVRHGPPGGPFRADRITVGGRTIARTGDSAWIDGLIAVGRAPASSSRKPVTTARRSHGTASARRWPGRFPRPPRAG